MKNHPKTPRPSRGGERLPLHPTRSKTIRILKKDWPYWVMMIIPLAFFLIFCYWPMFGLLIAFQNYKAGAPFIGATTDWVGLQWFKQLFANPLLWRLVRNTLMLSFYDLIITFPLGILFALLLNEIRHRWIRQFTSNVSLLPYFISTAIIVGIMVNLFSVDDGVINILLSKLGVEKQDFMGSSDWFRAMYTGSSIWANTGFNAVVFTAAIAGIDPTLYEAAAIDGSTRWKNMFRITIPCIMPTIIIMLLLRLGSVMTNGYDKILLMYSPATYETADTLGTYAYRSGVLDGKTSMSTAIGLLNSVCNLAMLLLSNRITRKYTETSLF